MIRCAKCKRLTRNNVATVDNFRECITKERGDCSRCGPAVKVESEGWEDWFGWPTERAP